MKTKAEKLASVKRQLKANKKFVKETRISVKKGNKTKLLTLEEFYQYKKKKEKDEKK